MYSTPVTLSYIDSPETNLEYLFTLNENELSLYTRGYIQCSRHIQEAIVDAKSRFLEAAFEEQNKQQLLNYVKLLDSIEETLSLKVATLQEYWPGEGSL